MKDTPQPGRPSQVADLPVPRVPDGFVPKERAEFLRTIGDKLTNAVFFQVIHHASGAFQFSHVSSGCQDVLGLSTDPLYERATALTDLILEEDRPAFFAAMAEAVATHGELDLVVRLRRADGAVRWGHFRSRSRPADHGAVICEGLLLDITDRKRVEAALGESRARNEAILSALPDLIFVMSRDGRYLDVHTTDPKALLMPPESFLGKHFADVLPPELAAKFQWAFDELAHAATAEVDYPLMIAGKQRHFEARMVQCSTDQTLCIVRDVTEAKQAHYDADRNRLELARVSRLTMLGEIAASLAHELNQPLAAILNNAQAAQQMIARSQARAEDTSEILADIAQDCRRAGDVIWRLRALLAREDVVLQPLTIWQLLTDVQPLLRSELLTRHVQLTTDVPSDLPEILGDRVQLQQVLLNLALNGVDAMADCPPEARELSITCDHVGDEVFVAVRDRGIGIPPEYLTRMFEPFFTTKPSGLGMGLRICDSTLRALGGRIWASNNADGGATITFTVPTAKAGA